eukprot:COSAG05_NODE_996_length_6253_cov_7.771856_5_plen_43_part_00
MVRSLDLVELVATRVVLSLLSGCCLSARRCGAGYFQLAFLRK